MTDDTQLLDYIDAFMISANGVVHVPGADIQIVFAINGVEGRGKNIREVFESIREQTRTKLVTAKLLGVPYNRVDPVI